MLNGGYSLASFREAERGRIVYERAGRLEGGENLACRIGNARAGWVSAGSRAENMFGLGQLFQRFGVGRTGYASLGNDPRYVAVRGDVERGILHGGIGGSHSDSVQVGDFLVIAMFDGNLIAGFE